MFNEAVVKEAITQSIAKSILDGISDADREELLQKSIAKSLKGWEMERMVSEVVCEQVIVLVREMLARDDVRQRIRDTLEKGFEAYLDKLFMLFPELMKETLHGKVSTNTYDRYPAAVLKFWPKSDEDKD